MSSWAGDCVWSSSWRRELLRSLPYQCPSKHLPRKAVADEDPTQWILLATHGDWRADIQVAKGVEIRRVRKRYLSSYIPKVRALGENQEDPPPKGGVS